MEAGNWLPSGMFFLVGAFIALTNGKIAVFRLLRRGDLEADWIPLAGGLLMFVGALTAPATSIHSYAWLAFVLDYGCAVGLASVAFQRWRAPSTLGAPATPVLSHGARRNASLEPAFSTKHVASTDEQATTGQH